ncbi:helix-turn-helix domain-containing protein [Deinococcus ruber]|uniref:helix-turn-helix domain-containing protein n=1 Tax=Deinococcus ruber TaxID=1848197 RepID=UPI00166CB99C
MTDCWLPSHWTRARLEERRLRFLQLRETQRHSIQELAESLGVSVRTIRDWKERLRH